jgi:AcrR family transcriptional regulator
MSDGRTEQEQEIVEATFRALQKHGYADLTIQKIGDEFEKSKSLLYYHYDEKDEIVRDLLDFAVEQFLADLDEQTDDDPVASLREMVDQLLPVEADEEALAARHVIVELRAQAVVNPEFRAAFTEIDERLYEQVRAYIERAVETGRLEVVNVGAAAEEFIALLNGALLESATTDRDVVPPVRAALGRQLDSLSVDG